MTRFCLVLLCSYAALSAAAKSPITMTDLLKIRRVTSVDMAPNGSYAIYGVQSIETDTPATGDPQYNYQTHLFYINLEDRNAKPIQLTHGKRNDGGVAISPDGKQFAFVRL